jgi:hypothetical protein
MIGGYNWIFAGEQITTWFGTDKGIPGKNKIAPGTYLGPDTL